MENAQSVLNLLLRRRRMYWWIPYIGLTSFVIGSAALLGAYLDGITFNEFARLFLETAVLSVILTILGRIHVWLNLFTERHAIERVLADYWACWSQFNSQEEWREFAQLEYENGKHPATSFSTALRTLIVIFIIIAVLSNGFLGWELWSLFGLGAVFCLAVGFTAIVRRKDVELNALIFEHRLHSPPPQAYLSSRGLYNEDTGYTTFRGLQDVHFVASSKLQEFDSSVSQVALNPPNTSWPSTEWSQVRLSIARPISRYSHYVLQLSIYVPPGFENDARQCVKRLHARVHRIRLKF